MSPSSHLRCCNQLLVNCKCFSFYFRQGDKVPAAFKIYQRIVLRWKEYFLIYHYHMIPFTTISVQITVLKKICDTKNSYVLIFLLYLCITYGLPLSRYSISAQHLVFSNDCWGIWIYAVLPSVLFVLLQLLSLYLVVCWLTVRYLRLH